MERERELESRDCGAQREKRSFRRRVLAERGLFDLDVALTENQFQIARLHIKWSTRLVNKRACDSRSLAGAIYTLEGRGGERRRRRRPSPTRLEWRRRQTVAVPLTWACCCLARRTRTTHTHTQSGQSCCTPAVYAHSINKDNYCVCTQLIYGLSVDNS